MQDTMVTESEPLIAIDDIPTETKTTQGTSTTEKQKLLTIDYSTEYKQKNLMKKILILVIVINLIVLLSILISA